MTDSDFVYRDASDLRQVNQLKRYLKGHNGFIAGGVFKNVINGERIKDIDIFFQSERDWRQAVKRFKKRKYTIAYENTRVMAFIDPVTHIRVELIGFEATEEQDNWPEDFERPVTYNDPEDTIDGFDFTITKMALYQEEVMTDVVGVTEKVWKIIHHKDFFEHLHLKRAVIDNDLVKPFSTFERALRYTKYGYQLCSGSKVKLIEAMQNEGFESTAQLSASFYDGID